MYLSSYPISYLSYYHNTYPNTYLSYYPNKYPSSYISSYLISYLSYYLSYYLISYPSTYLSSYLTPWPHLKGLLTEWKLTAYGTAGIAFRHRASSNDIGGIDCHEECAEEGVMGVMEDSDGNGKAGSCSGVLASHCRACRHFKDERTG